MTLIHLLPAVLSLLVLGAHFMRSGNIIMVALVLPVMALLGVRRPWAGRTAQTALLLGALEWVRTSVFLVAARTQAGQPFIRMILILGSVALLTGLSVLPFRGTRLRSWYEPGQEHDAASS